MRVWKEFVICSSEFVKAGLARLPAFCIPYSMLDFV